MQIAADAQDLYAQMQALKQQHQDEVISKAVRRIANRKLASAYYTWQSQYEQAKIRRVQIRRACARWNQRTLVRTFDALVTHAVERVRVRQLLLKVLGRVDNYATFRYVNIFCNITFCLFSFFFNKFSLFLPCPSLFSCCL
tara:strand:- start:60 stop:482 length:423 start_codon:yes stop_codon:yes gene_type:complete